MKYTIKYKETRNKNKNKTEKFDISIFIRINAITTLLYSSTLNNILTKWYVMFQLELCGNCCFHCKMVRIYGIFHSFTKPSEKWDKKRCMNDWRMRKFFRFTEHRTIHNSTLHQQKMKIKIKNEIQENMYGQHTNTINIFTLTHRYNMASHRVKLDEMEML